MPWSFLTFCVISHYKLSIEANYLGVIVYSKLNFNKHTDVICKKANSALSFLRRNLLSCNSKIKSDAYMMYVC